MEAIPAGASVSITELKRNPGAVIEAADNEAVAVLAHNKPSAYLVPAPAWQRLFDRLEDLELAELVRKRASAPASAGSRCPLMSCSLEFVESALKECRRLPPPIRDPFKRKLTERLEHPHAPGCTACRTVTGSSCAASAIGLSIKSTTVLSWSR